MNNGGVSCDGGTPIAGWLVYFHRKSHLKNMNVSRDDYSQLNGKINNVPNDQPDDLGVPL